VTTLHLCLLHKNVIRVFTVEKQWSFTGFRLNGQPIDDATLGEGYIGFVTTNYFKNRKMSYFLRAEKSSLSL